MEYDDNMLSWFLNVNLCGSASVWSAPPPAVEQEANKTKEASWKQQHRPPNETSTTNTSNAAPSPPLCPDHHMESIELLVQEEEEEKDEHLSSSRNDIHEGAPNTTSTTSSSSSSTRFRRLRKGASRMTKWSGNKTKDSMSSLENHHHQVVDNNSSNSSRHKILVQIGEHDDSSKFTTTGKKNLDDSDDSNVVVMEDTDNTGAAKSSVVVSARQELDHQDSSAITSLCCPPPPSFDGTEPVSTAGTVHSTPTLPKTKKDKELLCEWDRRPGTIGNLSPQQVQALLQLEHALFQSSTQPPLRHCSAHVHEDRTRMLLRFLRGTDFHASKAQESIRRHADFWHDFEMDAGMVAEQSPPTPPPPQEESLYFSCGRDVYGHPVMVARPCLHLAKHGDANLQHILCTLAKCCQRELDPRSDGTVVLYDCANVKAANFDLAFAKRLVGILDPHFPERVVVIIIIHNSWALQGMWALVSPLLDPVTRQKILVCGRDYGIAKKWLGPNHSYLKQCEEEYGHHHYKKRKRRPSSSSSDVVISKNNSVKKENALHNNNNNNNNNSTAAPVIVTPTVSIGFGEEPCLASEELAFLVVDPTKADCPILYVSNAYLRSTGYTAEAVIGKEFPPLLDGNDETLDFVRQGIADMMSSTSCGGGGLVCKRLCYRRDGSCFWTELHVAPVRLPSAGAGCNDDNKTRLVVAVQLDCTQPLSRSQQSSRQADPREWNVDASCKRLEPARMASHYDNRQVALLDPAQAMACAVESTLLLAKNATKDEEEMVRLTLEQFSKVRATTNPPQEESELACALEE